MAKIDRSKMADKVLIAIGSKKAPKEDTSSEEVETDEEEESEPGKLGRVLSSAIKHSDFEAIEEAIRNICHKED